MKKTVSRVICLCLSAMTAFSLVSCKKKGGKKSYDPESRPLVLASEALDGTFSPFFATAGPDTEIASTTQIGMLTTDESGELVWGQNQPTVALDFKEQEVQEAGKDYTDYKFIIKNGIKFSDGVDLTIKDVLFNLYVYLDPAYTGAATMYSTDIVGLKAYRTQVANADDEAYYVQQFEAAANDRITNLLAYLMGETEEVTNETQAIADIELFDKYHLQTVTSDWAMLQDLEACKDEFSFTETWEWYYYNEGIIKIETNSQHEKLKDENGKYITNAADFKADIDALKTGSDAENLEKIKQHAIQTVYTKDTNANISRGQALVRSFETYQSLWNLFVGEARMAQLGGNLAIPYISGITTGTTSTDFSGNDLGASHDVLNIRINKVDPKAKYNFSFAVAPMHYYSGTFEGVDYVATADPAQYKFGVKWGDPNFFEQVLQAGDKNAKPVGAGAYQASNRDGEKGDKVNGGNFWSGEWVYFTRNEYFETVGTGISNAKIKHLRYKIVATDALLQALISEDVDVGEPNATATNITTISDPKNKHLGSRMVNTNGYGYVGINPRYVPDVEVRRAIMMAMNTADAIQYYTEGSASAVHRSMSKESWLWDEWANMSFDTTNDPNVSYYGRATSLEQIEALLAPAGWYINSNTGKFTNADGESLKFTFTIAGATTDHPAYQMFTQAEYWLEQWGFDITIVTDVQALKKLARGELAVWAAAWSSTIDPDMYQVYHIDSTASSTKNWGYDWMKKNTADYEWELEKVRELSVLIDDGRETTNKQTRAGIYKNALDLVMELAVELPTYQRTDCVVYNKNVIDVKSLNSNATAYAGVIDKIWEVSYN